MKSNTLAPVKHSQILLALSRYDYRTHKGVAEFAAKHNWHLNCEMAITGMPPKNWKGDGILTLLADNEEVVNFVVNSEVPFVDISSLRNDISAPRVSADNAAIGTLAAEYYIDKGFRHFAFFSIASDRVAQMRRNAFFETASRRALSCSDWTMDASGAESVDLHQHLIEAIRGSEQPLALFASRDVEASFVLNACLEAGVSVPDQVAILGVDNNELITNAVQVPISSVNHNVEALGYAGAELLHEIICHGHSSADTGYDTRLIPPSGITSRRSTDCFAVDNPLVKKALIHINAHFHLPNFSVLKTAELCAVSRRHLDELFKQEVGHSMHAELTDIRLRSAKIAITMTDKTIERISGECGFTRVQYFNKCFKSTFGISPLQYRKLNVQ